MSPLWDWSSDHRWRPNREQEQQLNDDPEGYWLVEIRNWDHPTQWDEKVIKVERFPSGALEIIDGEQLRHHRDIRKWIRKVEDTDA